MFEQQRYVLHEIKDCVLRVPAKMTMQKKLPPSPRGASEQVSVIHVTLRHRHARYVVTAGESNTCDITSQPRTTSQLDVAEPSANQERDHTSSTSTTVQPSTRTTQGERMCPSIVIEFEAWYGKKKRIKIHRKWDGHGVMYFTCTC